MPLGMSSRRAWRVARTVAVVSLLAAGCSNQWTDGRFWHQPSEAKYGPPPMSISVGRAGGSAESGIGPGFTLSGSWIETGGVAVGRAGQAADSGLYRERSTSTGDVRDAPRYGRYREGGISTGAAEVSAQYGSYVETSLRVGVGG